MSLAICFNLDQSEFLSSDNGLRNDTVLCTLVITCFPHRKCITFSNLGALADESFILAQKMTFVVESIENLYRNSKVLFFFSSSFLTSTMVSRPFFVIRVVEKGTIYLTSVQYKTNLQYMTQNTIRWVQHYPKYLYLA